MLTLTALFNYAHFRYIFVDKFVFWKVFPICCLRWILQFSVFECPPNFDSEARAQRTSSFLDVLHRIISIWSRREFVQSSSMEQQACILLSNSFLVYFSFPLLFCTSLSENQMSLMLLLYALRKCLKRN